MLLGFGQRQVFLEQDAEHQVGLDHDGVREASSLGLDSQSFQSFCSKPSLHVFDRLLEGSLFGCRFLKAPLVWGFQDKPRVLLGGGGLF